MVETLLFIAIMTVIVLNYRREVWKHRAKLNESIVRRMQNCLKAEQDANEQLINKIPGALVYKPSAEWPEDIDA